MLVIFEDRQMGTHTHAWHLSGTYTHARTRTHTLSNYECRCMPDRKLKNHTISCPAIPDCTGSGRAVCIHTTTHKAPLL
jgi:hypothetical protein